MQIDITPLIQAIIAVLAALVTYKLVPWIKARTTAQQQANIAAVVKVAVYAAEELYGAGQGDAKLQHVQDWLAEKGFSVDVDTIKAAVNQMRDSKVSADSTANM